MRRAVIRQMSVGKSPSNQHIWIEKKGPRQRDQLGGTSMGAEACDM